MPSEAALYSYLIKFVHVFSGIYIWEYFTTIDFEWEVFTGKRPWKWSFVVYLIARLLALTATLCDLVGFNLTSMYDCNTWFRILLFASWFSVAVASFLLALRGIAIWGRHKGITVIAVLIWSANMIAASWSTTRGQIVWSKSAKACVITGTGTFRWGILTNLLVDLSLLCIMFVGVLRKKNATYLWKILYFQGIFWILTAMFTEVPCVVLPFMNMNDAWNLMFQMPHMVLMVIMSTRLYRDLFQYITNDHYVFATRANVWPAQVAIHRTVEVDFDIPHIDEEQPHGDYKQTRTVQSQVELEMIAAELQMKNDLQI
ncbi:hypothetical protein F5888DRAFT_1857794 [Russula emetica]|nr:hypothetical protein F5888DRAFT_1857794 [Russula emetica]